MIRIKELQGNASVPQWENFGAEYMARISPATAARLCGKYPTPSIGYETGVTINVTLASRPRLVVANISGAYFVRCAGWPMDRWPEIFDVEVARA